MSKISEFLHQDLTSVIKCFKISSFSSLKFGTCNSNLFYYSVLYSIIGAGPGTEFVISKLVKLCSNVIDKQGSQFSTPID